jgi:hypothetical protein
VTPSTIPSAVSDLEAYVDAASRLVGLDIAPEHRPGVIAIFRRLATMAALVATHAPDVLDESVPGEGA